MRVVTCLLYDHNLWFVLLAAFMCITGSWIATRLFQRTFIEQGRLRLHWCFISSVTAGAAVWATHFIAMLGYQPGVPVTFDGTLTIVSVLIAVAGTAIGLMLAASRNRVIAAICGGGAIGMAIAAMHYVGMFAYRADGVVSWQPSYVIASLICAAVLSAAAVDTLRRATGSKAIYKATGLYVLAIVSLHFVGMAAFSVAPLAGYQPGADSEAFRAMASAIALVAFLIIGIGVSTHFAEQKSRTEAQDRLRHMAHHDTLTGLANRHRFNEELERKFGCTGEDDAGFALLMVDLDRFKPINDTLGHPAGDQVLQKIAMRLRHAVREQDLVARIGGDEFAVIAHGVSDDATARSIADRIVEILARPFIIEGNIAELSGSVGYSLAPRDGDNAETLVQNSDVALYSAKTEGKNCVHRFEAHLSEAVQNRRRLETELRRACMREDFEVVYQPVVDSRTGHFTGAEALVRWTCPERGPVSPAEFIPIAEEMGLVSRIGSFVLRRACQEAARWPEDLKIAINVSTVQLLDPRLPRMVAQALEESGLPAGRLELEITETALVSNDEAALRTLNELSALGVSISLDDFGTGYSSLSYLHRFPINRLKIDRSFVHRLPESDSVSIIRAITQLGNSLQIKITAEGIETDDQYAFLAEHGCDDMQGFLISRPISIVDIEKLFGCADRNAA